LCQFAPDAEIHFKRVAVTREQIKAMKLPTRPTKPFRSKEAGKKGNPHAKGWKGNSVELDAIPPLELRRVVRECIERHIPQGYMDTLRVAERSEREIYERIAPRVGRLVASERL
jgi:hypothetical protein